MINIIIGVIFLIGGLSGTLVMKGTGSPIALAVLGAGLCVWGFFQMKGSSSKARPSPRRLSRRMTAKPTAKPVTKSVVRTGYAAQRR